MHLAGGLVAIVVATCLPSVVIRLTWLTAILRRERVRPAPALRGTLRLLLRASAAFTIMQACAVISYNSDQFIVARILGPLAVAQYAVPAKAFAVLMGVSGAATAALWPAFLDAVGRHDVAWVRKETRRVLAVAALGGGLFAAAFATVGPRVLALWVGGDYVADQGRVAAFACWGVVFVVMSALSFIVLGSRRARMCLIVGGVNTVVNLAASVLLTHHIGASGAVWGSVLSYTCVTLIPLGLLARRGIARLSSSRDVRQVEPAALLAVPPPPA